MLTPFISEFTDYCKNLNLAQNSIKEVVRYINQLNVFLQDYPLKEVKYLTYKQLFNYVIHDAPKPTTIKMRIWALKKFFAFLHLQDYIKENIANELKTPKIPKKETAFLSENELKIIIEYLIKNLNKSNGWRDFLIILLMAVCGLRKSSVVALDKEDFDAQNKRLFIKEKGAKSKRPIFIPLAILLLIQEYIQRLNIKTGPLFLNKRKRRMRPDGVNKIVDKIKTDLLNEGYDFAAKLHPHLFRHSAATQLNEVAGFTVTKEMLGHRNSQNTRKYIHLSPTFYGAYMKRHPYFNRKEF
jgi:site-specific recombinase XerD